MNLLILFAIIVCSLFGVAHVLSSVLEHEVYGEFGYIRIGNRVRIFFHRFTSFIYFFVIEPGDDGWNKEISVTVCNITVVFYIKTIDDTNL